MAETTITRTEIKEMVKKQIDQSVQRIVEQKVKELYSSKATQNEINELIAKTLIKFYKILWVRSSMWVKDIK